MGHKSVIVVVFQFFWLVGVLVGRCWWRGLISVPLQKSTLTSV